MSSDVVHRGAMPAGRFEFIAIGPEHAEPLAKLFERNRESAGSGWFDPFPLTASAARAIAADDTADVYFAADLSEQLVGMTMLRGWAEGYAVPSFGIIVDRDHRGRGIGREMTRLTLAHARAEGAKRVRLSVYGGNRDARRLYERFGFAQVGEPESASGRDDVRIVMELDLTARP